MPERLPDAPDEWKLELEAAQSISDKSLFKMGSRATFAFLLHFRVLWQRQGPNPNDWSQLSHTKLLGSHHEITLPSGNPFFKLASMMKKNPHQFPTLEDRTNALADPSTAIFCEFIELLDQIRGTESKEIEQSEKETNINVLGERSSFLELTPPKKVMEGPFEDIITQRSRLDKSPSRVSSRVGALLEPVALFDPLPGNKSKKPDIEHESSEDIAALQFTPPSYYTTLISSGEPVIQQTGIGLLILIARHTAAWSSLRVTPGNQAFIFRENDNTKKVFEARVDGTITKTLEEENGKRSYIALFEAKNQQRSNSVRCQESAEIVAYIRQRSQDTSLQKSNPEMEIWMLGLDGDQSFISIATWTQQYEDELTKIGYSAQEIKKQQSAIRQVKPAEKAAKNEPSGAAQMEEDMETFENEGYKREVQDGAESDPRSFLSVNEFGPFSLRNANSFRLLVEILTRKLK